MKIKRLYIKLFLSFLGVLFITEILILALFIVTAGRSFRDHIDKQSMAKLSIFKELVHEKIEKAPLVPLAQNNEIKELFQSFSNLFDVKIWLTSPDNEVLFKTFDTPVETIKIKKGHHEIYKDGIRLFHLHKRRIKYYAQLPIQADGRIHILHIHLFKDHEKKPEAVFLLGLLSIGTIVAILIVPLARIITKRIKQLNESALNFADGNLSCRTDIKGHDEIARLGKSFNFMADKLEKMIQGNIELTANISHELRTPLTRISVSKELIQDRLDSMDSQDLGKYVKNIEADINVLDNLIDKILKLSKMDSQESSLSIEQLDFNEILIDLEKKYLSALNLKGITFYKDFHEPLFINMDKNIVVSVLSNLFDNAIKYTRPEGTIKISAFKQHKDKLVFSITNTFRKLDPLELKKIFEPFYRIEGNKNPGSGMGLTIVQKQLKQCNSNIIALNSDIGITFQVQFSDQ